MEVCSEDNISHTEHPSGFVNNLNMNKRKKRNPRKATQENNTVLSELSEDITGQDLVNDGNEVFSMVSEKFAAKSETDSSAERSHHGYSKSDTESCADSGDNVFHTVTMEEGLYPSVGEFIADLAKLNKDHVLTNQDACNIFMKVKSNKIPWSKVQNTLSLWNNSFASVPYREFIACFLAVHTRKCQLQKSGGSHNELSTYLAEPFTLDHSHADCSKHEGGTEISEDLPGLPKVKRSKVSHPQESVSENLKVRLHYLEHRNQILELENANLKEKNKILTQQNRSLEINLNAWRHKVVRQVLQERRNKVKNKYQKQKQKQSNYGNSSKNTDKEKSYKPALNETHSGAQKIMEYCRETEQLPVPMHSIKNEVSDEHTDGWSLPNLGHSETAIPSSMATSGHLNQAASSFSQTETSNMQPPTSMDQEVLDMVQRIRTALTDTVSQNVPLTLTQSVWSNSAPVGLSQRVEQMLPNTISAAIVRSSSDGTTESSSEMTEVTEFARQFRIRRLALGLTQGQVSESLQLWQGLSFSKGAICRFEHMDITPKKAMREKPIFEKWLEEAETEMGRGVEHLAKFVGSEPRAMKRKLYGRLLEHLDKNNTQTEPTAAVSTPAAATQDMRENACTQGEERLNMDKGNYPVNTNSTYLVPNKFEDTTCTSNNFSEVQENFTSFDPDTNSVESFSKLPSHFSDLEGDEAQPDYSLASINQNFKISEGSTPSGFSETLHSGNRKADSFRNKMEDMNGPYPVFLLEKTKPISEKDETNISLTYNKQVDEQEESGVTDKWQETAIKKEPQEQSQCSVCLEMFDSDSLLQHLSTHLNAGEPDAQSSRDVFSLQAGIKEEPKEQFQCATCLQSFSDMMLLQQHLPTHLKERQMDASNKPSDIDEDQMQHCTQCPNCQLYFTNRGLYKHLRSCKKRLYRCTICEKALCKSFEELEKHMSSCRKVYKCTVCKAVYNTLEGMKNHFVSCRSKGAFT